MKAARGKGKGRIIRFLAVAVASVMLLGLWQADGWYRAPCLAEEYDEIEREVETTRESVNVLLLSSYHAEGKGTENYIEGIRSVFAGEHSVPVNLYIEYMDLLRFREEEYEQQLMGLYSSKYRNIQFDVIISHATPALDFLLKYRDTLFPGTPVVFSLVSESVIHERAIPANYVGIVSGPDFASTLDVILTALPETNEVLIIGGTSPVDETYFLAAQKQLGSFGDKTRITYLNQAPMEDILEKVAGLPRGTVVVYALIQQDGAGRRFLPSEVAAGISGVASVPVFALSETHMTEHHALVGGMVMSLEKIGSTTAATALDIARKDQPVEFTTYSEGVHSYIFDWRQMKRWGIDENRLPAGSEIRYQEISAWQQYRMLIIGVTAFIILETLLISLLLTNRARRIKVELSLRESEQKYRSLYTTMAQGVVYQDADGAIISANPAAERILGLTLEQLEGRKSIDPCWKSIREDGAAFPGGEHPAMIALRTGKPVLDVAMGVFNPEEDKHRWLLISAIPEFRKGEKKPFQVHVTFTDITERRKAKENLLELTKYQEMDKLKSNLLSVVSHELRTPLAGIKGYATLLLAHGRSLDDKQKDESLRAIDRSTDRLTELIDHLLDTSRLDAGLLKLNTKPANLQNIINTAVEDARMGAQHHSIIAEDSPNLPKLKIDAKRIRQVIDNLLSNAVKYSPEGSEITIRAESMPECIQVSVTDEGIGIAAEELDNIFGRMYRIERRLSEDPGGLGLGLNLCKALVEAHGGTIWAESKPGRGSTFRFTLPLDTGDESGREEGRL